MKTLLSFTKDLRPYDHEGLQMALSESSGIIGVYCIDIDRYSNENEFGYSQRSKFQLSLILEALAELKQWLQQLNIPLLVAEKSASACIPHIIEEHQIDQVIFQDEWCFEEQKELQLLKSKSNETIFKSYLGQFLWHPEDIPFQLHQEE